MSGVRSRRLDVNRVRLTDVQSIIDDEIVDARIESIKKRRDPNPKRHLPVTINNTTFYARLGETKEHAIKRLTRKFRNSIL